MRIRGLKTTLGEGHLEVMRLPRRLWRVTVPGIQDEDLREVVRAYLTNLHDHLDRGDGLLLWGANSTGKSGAAVVVAKEARVNGASVLFITAETLRQAVADRERFDEGPDTVQDRARDVELLVIDELGKEGEGYGGSAERMMENLIRTRSAAMRSTIITTNMDLGDIEARYKKSMVEVLREACLAVQVKGNNLRDGTSDELRRRLKTG